MNQERDKLKHLANILKSMWQGSTTVLDDISTIVHAVTRIKAELDELRKVVDDEKTQYHNDLSELFDQQASMVKKIYKKHQLDVKAIEKSFEGRLNRLWKKCNQYEDLYEEEKSRAIDAEGKAGR
jgi:Skp family chaperone for outer membrane proteins